MPLDNDSTAGEGDGMFPHAVNTNHRCIWHRLASICDASFDWGCELPVWGRLVVGVGDGSFE